MRGMFTTSFHFLSFNRFTFHSYLHMCLTFLWFTFYRSKFAIVSSWLWFIKIRTQILCFCLNTVNILYITCDFPLITVFFYMAFEFSLLIHTFINIQLAMNLIWRRNTTTKGAKNNTSPNVIRLPYNR